MDFGAKLDVDCAQIASHCSLGHLLMIALVDQIRTERTQGEVLCWTSRHHTVVLTQQYSQSHKWCISADILLRTSICAHASGPCIAKPRVCKICTIFLCLYELAVRRVTYGTLRTEHNET